MRGGSRGWDAPVWWGTCPRRRPECAPGPRSWSQNHCRGFETLILSLPSVWVGRALSLSLLPSWYLYIHGMEYRIYDYQGLIEPNLGHSCDSLFQLSGFFSSFLCTFKFFFICSDQSVF